MINYHFISYSSVDAKEFVDKLCDRLEADTPAYSIWLDRRELKSGYDDWDEQILQGIRGCESLVFVMTRDSVSSESVCKKEWSHALKFKKTIVLLKFHLEIEIPFQLVNQHYIDFTEKFEKGLSELRNNLEWLKSPDGKLQNLKARLGRAKRDLPRTDDPIQQARIKDEIEYLNQQIVDQDKIVKDPEGESKRVQESIATGMERERQPEKTTGGVTKTKFINPPPGVAPTYWQDRYHETELIGQFLENEVEHLMTVVGREGVGKTAMVCRLLKSLEGGRLPKNGEDLNGGKALNVDGIVYLSERGSRKVNFPNLYYDLCRLRPNEVSQDFDKAYKDATTNAAEKMQALLRAFPNGRFVVLMDNFEDKVNSETLEVEDEEMNDALTALLTSEPHAVKIILTTRIAPRSLSLVEPAKQRRLDLDKGLDSPYAENILREMDIDGKVGLKKASDEVLDEARNRTNGNPRALEALFATLSADRETSLSEILTGAEKLLPEHVVTKMVGDAYSRLDADAQMVMQALAIYGLPVSNVAVDYLLQPHLVGVDSAKVLNRLIHMHFVRKEGRRYYLHPVDREYVLDRIPKDEPKDRWVANLSAEAEPSTQNIFNQYTLLERAAQYYRETRLPRADWKNLTDLAPQLAEFELRFQSKNYDTASEILLEISFDYLRLWGHWQLVVEHHQRLQGKIENDFLKRESHNLLGICYSSLGDYEKAMVHYQQSLDIARKIGDRQGEGNSLGNLGSCYGKLGDHQKAMDHGQQWLDIAREIGARRNEGIALSNLGSSYHSLGHYQKAKDHYQQSLDIAREIGNREGEGIALGGRGNSFFSLDNNQKAMDDYRERLNITREISDRQGVGDSHCGLGLCYSKLGDHQKAMDHGQQSLDITREIGHREGEGIALSNLGSCYHSLGDYQKAKDHYEQSLDIAREIGHREVEGIALGNLGSALLFLNDTHLAEVHLRDSAAIYEKIDTNVVEGYCHLGIALLKSGQYQEGKTNLEKAVRQADIFLQQANSVDTIDLKALALCGLAVCEHDRTYADNARKAFAQARAITKAKGQVGDMLKLFNLIAELDEESLLAGVREVVAGTEK